MVTWHQAGGKVRQGKELTTTLHNASAQDGTSPAKPSLILIAYFEYRTQLYFLHTRSVLSGSSSVPGPLIRTARSFSCCVVSK